MSLKAQLEAIIYAAENPISLDHLVQLTKSSVMSDGAADENQARSRIRTALEELVAEYATSAHGIEIRQLAGGYRMSTKPEHHDVVKDFAKSLKPPIRLSLPALETLAVIAYKQPVTVPEISERLGPRRNSCCMNFRAGMSRESSGSAPKSCGLTPPHSQQSGCRQMKV